MRIRVAALLMVGLVACAPVPEPETPPPVAPTKRAPQREPLPPAPSGMPDIVYAMSVHGTDAQSPHAKAAW